MTDLLSLVGKTITAMILDADRLTLSFDDGSEVRISARVTGGCCCCGEGYLDVEDYAPMFGPEPPPPPPEPVAFWREGEHAVTIRSIEPRVALDRLDWNAVFTLDDEADQHRYFAPLNARPPDEFVDALPIPARLTIKQKTTWDKLNDINAGREPEPQSFTFTFDLETEEG